MFTLTQFVQDFARALIAADARGPVAKSQRGTGTYLPGIGPHGEPDTVRLAMLEAGGASSAYAGYREGVPYPETPRQRCDLVFGESLPADWAIEAKLMRMLGDNGRPNDNMVAHILSPYPSTRSALTDCVKLRSTSLADRKAVVVLAYEYPNWPADPVIEAFELLASDALARAGGRLGDRTYAPFEGLIHPVQRQGRAFGWEIS